jgi:hypothetical protein
MQNLINEKIISIKISKYPVFERFEEIQNEMIDLNDIFKLINKK